MTLTTHRIAKKMVDHALDQGWDEELVDSMMEGFYFQRWFS